MTKKSVIVNGYTVTELDDGDYEGVSHDGLTDFAITVDSSSPSTVYILDVFDSSIVDDHDTYIESFECDSLESAVSGGVEYIYGK